MTASILSKGTASTPPEVSAPYAMALLVPTRSVKRGAAKHAVMAIVGYLPGGGPGEGAQGVRRR